jgi:hypothetical protein
MLEAGSAAEDRDSAQHLARLDGGVERERIKKRRRKFAVDLRTREYLTEGEVERLIEAAKGNPGATATPA